MAQVSFQLHAGPEPKTLAVGDGFILIIDAVVAQAGIAAELDPRQAAGAEFFRYFLLDGLRGGLRLAARLLPHLRLQLIQHGLLGGELLFQLPDPLLQGGGVRPEDGAEGGGQRQDEGPTQCFHGMAPSSGCPLKTGERLQPKINGRFRSC